MPGSAVATAAAPTTPVGPAPAGPAVAYDFDGPFQDKITAMVLRDTQFAQMTDGLVEPVFFENAGNAALVKVAKDYFAVYKKAPGDSTTLAALIRQAIAKKTMPTELARLAATRVKDLFASDISDRDFVADQVATFARHQAVTRAILDSVELVEKHDFDQIGKMVRKALDTGVNVMGSAYNYAEMVKARTKLRKDRLAGIAPPTGITTGKPALDDYLYHKGWGRRELSVYMGPAKAGKSMALIDAAISASIAGYKTLYVTLEVASTIVAERIDANVSDTAMSDLAINAHTVEDRVLDFMSKAAPLVIHEFPTGTMRVSDLRRLLEHYKAQGTMFDLVVIDYADLMAPERVTDNVQENSKSVYVNLRGLAMLEDFACLTATQTNREGAKKAVATMTDVAEDFNKIRIADVVISINRTEEETREGQARLFFAASRNQRSGFTLRIQQDIERAKFIKKVIGEE
jgi:replicative DNA helicase